METFNKTEYNTEYRKKALKEKKKAQFNTDLYNESDMIYTFVGQRYKLNHKS